MKKVFAIMTVAAVITTAAFAQDGSQDQKETKKPGLISAGLFILPSFGAGSEIEWGALAPPWDFDI